MRLLLIILMLIGLNASAQMSVLSQSATNIGVHYKGGLASDVYMRLPLTLSSVAPVGSVAYTDSGVVVKTSSGWLKIDRPATGGTADGNNYPQGFTFNAATRTATLTRSGLTPISFVITSEFAGLLEYADNTAALAAGLAIGKPYRTGDVLKITH